MTGQQLGFIGLGKMGTPMVRRLVGAGHRVSVFDVSTEAVRRVVDSKPPAAGSVVAAASVADVAKDAAAVILMLPNSDIVEQVVLRDGLLDALDQRTVLVDMSSSEPARTRALAQQVVGRGIALVDAPVSGGVAGAIAGTLTIMVGGDQPALGTAWPILTALGSRVIHAGSTGAGHAAKALNNLMSAAHLIVTSEALLAGTRFGLDPAVVLDIVNGSSGRSGSTQTKWPQYVLTGTYDSGFALRLMLKDMEIALALERETGTPAPVSAAAVAAWKAAAAALPADADHTEIVRWLEMTTGTGSEA